MGFFITFLPITLFGNAANSRPRLSPLSPDYLIAPLLFLGTLFADEFFNPRVWTPMPKIVLQQYRPDPEATLAGHSVRLLRLLLPRRPVAGGAEFDPCATWATLASRRAKPNHCTPFRWSQFLLNPHDARESASLIRVKYLPARQCDCRR